MEILQGNKYKSQRFWDLDIQTVYFPITTYTSCQCSQVAHVLLTALFKTVDIFSKQFKIYSLIFSSNPHVAHK